MLKSMTAYGRASSNNQTGHFVFEIQSVNRKFLDMTIAMPRELSQFEIEIKKWLIPHVARGQITLKISASFENAIPFLIRPNLPLARQLKSAWQAIVDEIGIESKELTLEIFSQADGLLKYEENLEEEETFRQILKSLFEEALYSFLQMKIYEGQVLQKDVAERIEKIYVLMEGIKTKVPDATFKYREKLINRLNEVVPGYVENEERILREIALFAEKIDIAEEITRFAFHIKHLQELIQSPEVSVGKTLEFVLQELNREINTIGSKSSNVEISRAVIDIKSELEKIREQIQNVE